MRSMNTTEPLNSRIADDLNALATMSKSRNMQTVISRKGVSQDLVHVSVNLEPRLCHGQVAVWVRVDGGWNPNKVARARRGEIVA